MNELIEKLKKNKTCFCLLSEEEQNCFEEVGIDGCKVIRSKYWAEPILHGFFPDFTYRIKPDYQPEQKEKKIEVMQQKACSHPQICRYSRLKKILKSGKLPLDRLRGGVVECERCVT